MGSRRGVEKRIRRSESRREQKRSDGRGKQRKEQKEGRKTESRMKVRRGWRRENSAVLEFKQEGDGGMCSSETMEGRGGGKGDRSVSGLWKRGGFKGLNTPEGGRE